VQRFFELEREIAPAATGIAGAPAEPLYRAHDVEEIESDEQYGEQHGEQSGEPCFDEEGNPCWEGEVE
jgi:hypothetical protein